MMLSKFEEWKRLYEKGFRTFDGENVLKDWEEDRLKMKNQLADLKALVDALYQERAC